MRYILQVVIPLFICAVSSAQNFSVFPEDIIVRNTMTPSLADYLENPLDKITKASIYHKQRAGLFKEVRSTQLNAQYSIKNSNIGLHAITNMKGDFIRRNRFYLNAANHIEIKRKHYLAGGISIGFIDYTILSNSNGPSGSDYDLDISFAGAYYNEKTTINLSFNQLTSPTLAPIYEETTLPKFVQALVVRNYILNYQWDGYIYAREDIYSDEYKQFSAGYKIEYEHKISAGMSFNSDGDFFTCVGFKYEAMPKRTIDIFFGYQVQTGAFEIRHQVSSYQVGLIFSAKK